MTIKGFVKKYDIQCEAIKVFSNPNMEENKWSKDSKHWQVKLTHYENYQRPSLVLYFSQGLLVKKRPTAEDLLNCVIMDDPKGESFDDWASNYGYETDSLTALETYKICAKQSKKARQWLGSDKYEELLTCETL